MFNTHNRVLCDKYTEWWCGGGGGGLVLVVVLVVVGGVGPVENAFDNDCPLSGG